MIRNKQLIFLFTLFALALCLVLINIKAITYNCYNAIDFSIYQQAVYDMWSKGNWNPYLTIRDVHIFNDHFDPILMLATLFTGIFGQGFKQLLFFEWFFFILTLGSIYIVSRENEGRKSLTPILYLSFGLFSKFFLGAIFFPIHPTTWSMLPLFWLVVFVSREDYKKAAILLPVLCLFKESFSFATIMLVPYLIYKKEHRWAIVLGLICLSFISFELIFKKKLIGDTVNYGSRLLTPLLDNPFTFLGKILSEFSYKDFFKSIYPFLGCFAFWAYVRRKNVEKSELEIVAASLLVFFPLLFLQVFANKINFQYGAQFGGLLFGSMVSLRVLRDLSKKQISIILLLFMASSLGTYTKGFKGLFASKFSGNKCVVSNEKLAESKKVVKVIESLDSKEKVLMTGGLIPFALRPDRSIYHFKGFSKGQESYDYLVMEKGRSGDIYPANSDQVNKVITQCSIDATEVILDSKFYFFAKGNFGNCLK